MQKNQKQDEEEEEQQQQQQKGNEQRRKRCKISVRVCVKPAHGRKDILANNNIASNGYSHL